MRIISKLALGLLVVAAFPLLLLYVLQDRMIFPAPDLDTMPEAPSGFTEVSIETPDGETLFALFRPPAAGRATIIVFHGNGDAAAFQHAKADALSKRGFGVLLAEYRGYPGSSGSPSEAGLYTDATSAYDFLAARIPGPVGVYGHSLGAAVAIHLATVRDIYALVLESPFDSLLAVAKRHYPWVPAMDKLLKHPFRSDRIISGVSAPILILHGANDRIVPAEHARELLRLAPQGTQYRDISDAGHNDLARHGSIDMAVTFFEENDSAPKPTGIRQ